MYVPTCVSACSIKRPLCLHLRGRYHNSLSVLESDARTYARQDESTNCKSALKATFSSLRDFFFPRFVCTSYTHCTPSPCRDAPVFPAHLIDTTLN